MSINNPWQKPQASKQTPLNPRQAQELRSICLKYSGMPEVEVLVGVQTLGLNSIILDIESFCKYLKVYVLYNIILMKQFCK